MTNSADIKELHDRQYSLYNSKREQEEALQELHEQNYMIFDEFETEFLKEEFREEFERVAHEMTFVSMLEQAKKYPTFLPKKKSKKTTKSSSHELLTEQELKNKALGDVIAALLTIANGEPIVREEVLAAHDNQYALTFYIIKKGQPNRTCNAHGFYDYNKKRFVIAAGSMLSLDVTPSYAASTSNLQRRNFLNKYCEKRINGYYVKVDAPCVSPSAAACYATGRSANGWVEWKDSTGKTLKESLTSLTSREKLKDKLIHAIIESVWL